MKKLVLILSICSFAEGAMAAWTATNQGNTVAITTRSQARTALSAAKTASATTNTGSAQPYTDCGGCPIPNDTGMGCMVCPPPAPPM